MVNDSEAPSAPSLDTRAVARDEPMSRKQRVNLAMYASTARAIALMSTVKDFRFMQQPQVSAPQDDRTLAMLTHLSGILFGFIVPLVVWLTQKDTKPWVADEAKEALNFQITVLIGYVVGSALMLILVGIVIVFAVLIANLILCIIAGLKANTGESYRYPMTLRLIK